MCGRVWANLINYQFSWKKKSSYLYWQFCVRLSAGIMFPSLNEARYWRFFLELHLQTSFQAVSRRSYAYLLVPCLDRILLGTQLLYESMQILFYLRVILSAKNSYNTKHDGFFRIKHIDIVYILSLSG